MDLAFFGHHKCASTSTEALCFEICNKIGYYPIYKKTSLNESILPFLKSEGKNFIISINSDYRNIDYNHQFRGIHIVRDPRDICVSGYFSHLYSHKLEGFERLKEHREKLMSASLDEGLLIEIEFMSYWLNHIENWNYGDGRILEVKLEEIIRSPFDIWMKIFNWFQIINQDSVSFRQELLLSSLNHYFRIIGIPNLFLKSGLSIKQLNQIIEKYSFKSMSKGRETGKEDIKSHYRKGIRGDWKNYFNKKHKTIFKEKYGDLLIKLGYESGGDW